jgi:hypothetical protein
MVLERAAALMDARRSEATPVESGEFAERNRLGGYLEASDTPTPYRSTGIMRLLWLPVALSLVIIACQDRDTATVRDTAEAQPPADSPAAASSGKDIRPAESSRPADSAARLAVGKEPGTIPATPTPAVTSENSIAALRMQLQRLDTASAQSLQAAMQNHSRMVGDLLTTMRVEVAAATSPTKDSWLAAADTVESDLNRLALANGEELRSAFREHRTRVLRLLDRFRVLVPAKAT